MEEAAPLQLWHHQPREVLVSSRHVRGRENEAVARAAGEPFLEPVRDVRRRADETRELLERGACAVLDVIPRARIRLAAHAYHAVPRGLQPTEPRHLLVGERLVERLSGEV